VRAEASVFGINVLPTTKQELFPLGSLPFVTVCGTLCVSAGLRASVQGEHTERALAASPSLPPPLSPLPPSLSISLAFGYGHRAVRALDTYTPIFSRPRTSPRTQDGTAERASPRIA